MKTYKIYASDNKNRVTILNCNIRVKDSIDIFKKLSDLLFLVNYDDLEDGYITYQEIKESEDK